MAEKEFEDENGSNVHIKSRYNKLYLSTKVFKYSSLMLNQPHGKVLVAAYLCNAISW